MDQTCLMAGAGYTGLRLARRLQPRWRVVALARSEAAAARLSAAGLGVLRADLDGKPAPGALSVADGAAIAYLVPPPEGTDDDPRLAGFLGALGEARPNALLYVSTTGVYGDTGGGVVTEASPVMPSSDRGRRRAAAERIASEW
ncbi:MAG: hypothetical protein QG586_1533 [Pseudomonadota bacterium]|nr:hypothetical protein [Pseudomonadota bacterium]